MGSEYTGHVTPVEWRWVILVSTALVSLAFLPFLWVLVIGLADSQWQFMGALHDYTNGAAELARVSQGTEGIWLVRFLHTPEPHDGALINPLYALLGQVSRLTSLSAIVIFHVARVGAALFMYMAIYQLGASIWMRLRTRRVFFILAALGSGLGWLFSPLTQDSTYLDLTAPQAYPFYSTLANVHFPLAIAFVALLVGVLVVIFRPGENSLPDVNNGGLVIALSSLALVLLYPLAFVTISLAFVICVLLYWYRRRTNITRELRWLLWLAVPPLPLLVYYAAVRAYNPVVAQIWAQQNEVAPPTVLVFMLGLGLMLLLALPGILRALRRFELDGDQFMLVWLLVIIALLYMPVLAHRGFVIGLMLPLAYFVTRSMEDFWFDRISRRWRMRVLAALLPVLAASQLLVLMLPLQPIAGGDFANTSGMLLQRDYLESFHWLREQTGPADVILAAPEVGVWVPVWTRSRVIYGHPLETVDAASKRNAVRRWYRAESVDLGVCRDLLLGDDGRYRVRYVLVGPYEEALGAAACTEILALVGSAGSVRIYSTASLTTADR
jgi:hypothetical protein